MTDECFVLIPVDGILATACFADEFTEAWQWSPSVDHIIPRSQGGSDDWSNLHVAHRGCQHKQGGFIGGRMSKALGSRNGAHTRDWKLHPSPFRDPEIGRRGGRIGGPRCRELYENPFVQLNQIRKGTPEAKIISMKGNQLAFSSRNFRQQMRTVCCIE